MSLTMLHSSIYTIVLTIILLREIIITRRNKQEGEADMRRFVDKVSRKREFGFKVNFQFSI